MPTGWRNCSRCTRWRPVTDYRIRSVHKPVPYVETIYLQSYCTSCERRAKRERYYNLTHIGRSIIRERKREQAAAERRKRGVPPRVVGPDNKGKYGAARTIQSNKIGSVDPVPILRECERQKLQVWQIAVGAGVDERTVQRWFAGEWRMNVDAADRLCLYLGVHLSLIQGCE
jgi:hypothetical protein